MLDTEFGGILTEFFLPLIEKKKSSELKETYVKKLIGLKIEIKKKLVNFTVS